MKEIILLLSGILIGHQLMAQTFSEWFRQNHTQLKYLAAQIAALDGYHLTLKKGYALAEEGLDSIWSTGADDLDLHTNHFESLELPSSAIIEDEAVFTIRQYCVLLPILAGEIEDVSRGLPAAPLNWPEMGPAVAMHLRDVASISINRLGEILSGDKYRMDDAGRLRLLNEISREMRSVYGKASFLLVQLDPSTINPWL